MAIRLADGLAGELGIDAVSKAARVTLYGPDGNPIAVTDDQAIVPGAQQGIIAMGSNYKNAQPMRVSSFGTLRTSDETLFLYDSCEGAAVDTNKWLNTLATMTITQSAVTGILFNAASSVTTAQGAMQTSVRRIPRLFGSPMAYRCRARMTAHFNNNIIELGFGTPATSVALPAGDGAFWRKDGTGQYVPVISVNNNETLGTPIPNATIVAAIPVTDYGIFEVMVSDSRATFNIFTNGGVLVVTQTVDFTGSTPGFAVTHFQAFARLFNNGAVGTAVQLFVHGVYVTVMDGISQRPYEVGQSGMSLNSLTSPTTYAQLAASTNNTGPTPATLTNTTAAASTALGGLIAANAMAAGANDLILFGWQCPVPYTFYFTGIRIPAPLNQVVAVATSDTLFHYGMAFNSSAVSLATGAPSPPMRIALSGMHRAPVALAALAQFSGNEIVWQPATPIPVQPGKFLHLFLKCLLGTATATETYAWLGIVVDGYFE